MLKKIGQHGQDTAELFFDGVRVPVATCSAPTRGRASSSSCSSWPRSGWCWPSGPSAAIEETLRLTVDYTKQREAFGRPVFNFQNTKFTLAEVRHDRQDRAGVHRRLRASTCAGELDIPTASMAKWWLTQQQCDVADECLQLFGGYGYMQEYPISRIYTDSRIQKIYGGTNEIMKEIITPVPVGPRPAPGMAVGPIDGIR